MTDDVFGGKNELIPIADKIEKSAAIKIFSAKKRAGLLRLYIANNVQSLLKNRKKLTAKQNEIILILGQEDFV